jgi:hypothetical protein
MKRKLVVLMALLASLSLAQTVSPRVIVNIPPLLRLTLNANEYLFDFANNSLSGTERVTVGSDSYTKASQAAYYTFLDTATSTQDFAPTSLRGTGGDDYGTVTIRSNQPRWVLKIASISGSLTLGNIRVKVFVEKVSGEGNSMTNNPIPIGANEELAKASLNGRGTSIYRLYFLFTMDINDNIPNTGINNEQITVNLLLTSL